MVACCAVEELAELRYVLCFESVSSRAEKVERLSVHEEHGFLTLVDDELCKTVEVLARVLPYECIVVTLVFDYLRYLTHMYTSMICETT